MSPRVGRALSPPPPSRPLPGLGSNPTPQRPQAGKSTGALGGRRAEGGPAARAWGPGRARSPVTGWRGAGKRTSAHCNTTAASQASFNTPQRPGKMAAGKGRARRLLPAPDPRGQASTGRATSCRPGLCWASGGLQGRGVPPAPPASRGRGSLGPAGSSTGGGQEGAVGTELPPGPAHVNPSQGSTGRTRRRRNPNPGPAGRL